jgi:hypothetical protein
MGQVVLSLMRRCLEIRVTDGLQLNQTQIPDADPQALGVCGEITITATGTTPSSIVTATTESSYLFVVHRTGLLWIRRLQFDGSSVALLYNTESGVVHLEDATFATSVNALQAAMDPITKCCVLGLIRNDGEMHIARSIFTAISGRAIFSSMAPGGLHLPYLEIIGSIFDHIDLQPCGGDSVGTDGESIDGERTGCTFAPKQYHGFGAAVFVGAGEVQIKDSSFISNTASEAGAGIYQQGGEVQIMKGTMQDNSALKNGGAVYSENGRLSVAASSFVGNVAGRYGGAIMLSPAARGTYRVTHLSTFNRNIATAGAAVFAALGNEDVLVLEDVDFVRNRATAAGAAAIETLGAGGVRAHRCRFRENSVAGRATVQFGAGVASNASTVAVRTPTEFIDCEFVGQMREGDAIAPGVAAFIASSFEEEVIFQRCSFSGNGGGSIGVAWAGASTGRRMQDRSDPEDPWDPSAEMPVITLASTVIEDGVSGVLLEILTEKNMCRRSDGEPLTGDESVSGVAHDEWGFTHAAFCDKGFGCDDSAPTAGLECKECPPGQHSPDGKLCRKCPDGMHALAGSAVCESSSCPVGSQTSSEQPDGSTFCMCEEELWYVHDGININQKSRCTMCPSGAICENRDDKGFMALKNAPGHWLNTKTMVAFPCPRDDRDLCVECELGTSVESPVIPSDYGIQDLQKSTGRLFDSFDADASGYLEEQELEAGVAMLGSVFGGTSGASDVGVLWSECGGEKGNRTVSREDFVDRIQLATARLSSQPLVAATCCRPGHSGVLCSICEPDWVKTKGRCIPCKDFHHVRLAGVLVTYGLLVLLYWFKAWRLKKAQHVDEQCQSAAVVLLVFFFQTSMLLDIDLMPVGFSIDFFNMDLDSPKSDSGMCLSTGEFYWDWALRFFLPSGMLLFACIVCLVTMVPRHKLYTVLASVLLFTAFPMNLHAFSVFFCMDASPEYADQRNQDGLLATEGAFDGTSSNCATQS